MLHKTTQLSVMAVAALAIVAVVAVALFAAGGARAENTNTAPLTYESGGAERPNNPPPPPPPGPTPTPQPHPTPEACADPPADLVTRGSVAIFDVYWDDDETLNNNPCPPTVMHEDVGNPPVEVTHRSPSDVEIGHTIVHIRDLAVRTLVKSTDPRVGQDGVLAVDKDSVLWQAYPDDGTDPTVWFLPVFESEEAERQTEEAFHLGFSAGLLRDGDWEDDEVEYEFEVIREPTVAADDRGVILVATDNSFRTENVVQWDTRNPDNSAIVVEAGEYEHRAWAFTKPGTYILSVHAKGRPRASLGANPDVVSVTSEPLHYIFHVGLLADVSVDVSDITPVAPVDTTTFTVTASNAGPQAATDVRVELDLSSGIRLVDGSRTWKVGKLAAGASRQQTFTVRVDGDAHAAEQTVTAEISAIEHIGRSEVVELDPRLDNNTDSSSFRPISDANNNPFFALKAHPVSENAPAGTLILGPLSDNVDPDTLIAHDDDPSDVPQLRYSLGGGDAAFFHVDQSTGEITVKDNVLLNYECKPSYRPLLQVSDGKDENGQNDFFEVVDDHITVLVNLNDQVEGTGIHASKTQANLEERVTLTLGFGSYAGCAPFESFHWEWEERATTGDDTNWYTISDSAKKHQIVDWQPERGTYQYRTRGSITGADGVTFEVNFVSPVITWGNP